MNIEQRFVVIKKKLGRYHGFPTLVRQGRKLWLACRSGTASPHQAHGIQGKVLLFSADLSTPGQWKAQGSLFVPPTGSTGNELDAILSMPEPDLFFLATRDYERNVRNDVYLSRGHQAALTERQLLTNLSDHYAICFGHIRRTFTGELLMPGYCGFSDEPSGTPVLLVSKNRGRTWSLRSKVANSTKVGTRLTEYSIGYLGKTSWTALIRNETPPFHLYRTESDDDGRSWTFPKKTKLCGHAPMILDCEAVGGHLVLYRDLSETDPGVAIGTSSNKGVSWKRIGRLVSYSGGIYDGGYGDLVQLDQKRILAVYYICDEDASPWIEGCVFSIKHD